MSRDGSSYPSISLVGSSVEFLSTCSWNGTTVFIILTEFVRTGTRMSDWKLLKRRRGGKYILFLLVGQFSTLMLSVLRFFFSCLLHPPNRWCSWIGWWGVKGLYSATPPRVALEDDTESRWTVRRKRMEGISVFRNQLIREISFATLLFAPKPIPISHYRSLTDWL